jgi:DNA-binding NtrC family response regulator
MSRVDDTTLRVAIVEDEPRLRELLVREITAMGHLAEGFATAELAWGRIESGLDAILLDLNLPGMQGMELFRRIREESLDTSVIILTGFGAFDSAVQAIRWRAEDFLTKPCSLADIDRVLARVLARRRDRDRDSALRRTEVLVEEPAVQWQGEDSSAVALGSTLEELQRQRVLEALEKHGGNKPAVAAELGISLRTLYYRVNEYRQQGYMA